MSEQSTSTPTPEQPQVEYRDIPGFPGYRVGDDGSVWSYRSRNGLGPLKDAWRLMSFSMAPGRATLTLRAPGAVRRTCQVHHLVLLAFVGPKPPGLWALHRDDNPLNNTLANLYYGTPRDNAADRRRNGHERFARGSEMPQAVLTEDLVREIRRARAGRVSQKKLAARFSLPEHLIRQACGGRAWRHVDEPLPPKMTVVSKTHCKRGHPLSGDNVHINAKGHRHCRACDREAKRHERLSGGEEMRQKLNERWRRWYAQNRAKGSL